MFSEWKITSKEGYFRIEPEGEKMKEIELPTGNYIYARNIKIIESIDLSSKDKINNFK